MLVDTHAHIGGGDTDEAEVISDLEKGCPDRIVCASYDVASSERSVLLARKHEKLYCAVGVHPSDESEAYFRPLRKTVLARKRQEKQGCRNRRNRLGLSLRRYGQRNAEKVAYRSDRACRRA